MNWIKNHALYLLLFIPAILFACIGLCGGLIASVWIVIIGIYGFWRNDKVYYFYKEILYNHYEYYCLLPDYDILWQHFWLPLDINYYIHKNV